MVGTKVDHLKEQFRELSYKMPEDLLRRTLIEISSTPQSFYVLRTNFCQSMAVMSVAHWILGVGDRHLLNVLMNTKTGHLIGIDFNVVFEAGFRNLPIPELIPFRLTPQFVNVMMPFGTTGLISSCMVHALKVFRRERKLLLACLEVFLREPTIDWLYTAWEAQDDPMEFLTLTTDTRVHWEPTERIASVNDKLNGINPTGPIAKGLESSSVGARPKVLEAYMKILSGNARDNVRARLPSDQLNVEDQVACLIDLATDASVLGCTYQGMFPWL